MEISTNFFNVLKNRNNLTEAEIIDRAFAEIWKPIVCDADGNLDIKKVKAELTQYYLYFCNTKEVFKSVFGLDNLDYPADYIIACHSLNIKRRYIDKAELKALLDEYKDIESIELLISELHKILKRTESL